MAINPPHGTTHILVSGTTGAPFSLSSLMIRQSSLAFGFFFEITNMQKLLKSSSRFFGSLLKHNAIATDPDLGGSSAGHCYKAKGIGK